LALVVVVGAALVLAVGQDPWEVGVEAVHATLLSGYGLGQVLFKATPLILTGLAVAIPFSAGLFNVGGEGQLVAGALACAVVAQAWGGSVGAGATVAGMVAAAAVGAGAGAVAGALKAWRHVHEVISTIMLNFILAALCGYLLAAHLQEPGTAHTPELPGAVLFTRLSAWAPSWAGSNVSTSLLVALALALLAQGLMDRTVLGYELRASGAGPLAALHAGIPWAVMTVGSLALGGGLAGLAGAHFVLGARRYFEEGLSGGEGFLGIAVALMARGAPWAVVPAALVFGGLSQAGLSVGSRVPREIVQVLQALVVLSLAGSAAWARRRGASAPGPAPGKEGQRD
jgi:simple sugar transport system permease protein